MTLDLRIEGADQLSKVAVALKQHGSKELRGELTKAITRSVKPLKKDVKAHATNVLPSRGGLGARVAKTTLQHRRRTSASNPGISIHAKPSSRTLRDPARVDKGRARHPVYGMAASRAAWVLQDVPPGWFTKPLQDGGSEVREEIVKAMQDVADKIARAAS